MKEYIDMVHRLIEIPRNELRDKVLESDDENLKKVLNDYEAAYHRSCLKIEEYIDNELKDRDLVQRDWVFLFCIKSVILLQEGYYDRTLWTKYTYGLK